MHPMYLNKPVGLILPNTGIRSIDRNGVSSLSILNLDGDSKCDSRETLQLYQLRDSVESDTRSYTSS